MPRSHRHHYVPQFLTKGFLNSEEKITVYDKIQDKYYPGNPLNLFLENDRNTFLNFENVEDDIIERVYASFDGIFSSALKEISDTNRVSNENFQLLLFLAYISKWRVPQYDEAFKNAKDYFSVNDLGLGFKDENNRKLDFDLEAHFKLDMQQEFKRLLLAIQPFRFKEDFKRLLRNSFLINTPINSFISDCPFIEATIISDEIFEDFIFPVSRDLTLVYSSRVVRKEIQDFLNGNNTNGIQLFLQEFSTARDVSLLNLAERNVACGNSAYLKYMVETYKQFKSRGTGTPFYMTVFNVIYRFKEYAEK